MNTGKHERRAAWEQSDDDNDNENLFQPITLDRKERIQLGVDHGEQKSDKKQLSVMMQISQNKEDQVVAKEFDDILDCDNLQERNQLRRERKTGGELMDEDFQDTFKNFSFNDKTRDPRLELLSPDFLLNSRKEEVRKKSLSRNIGEESQDADSSLNNRASEDPDSSFQLSKRFSAGQKPLFKNTSLNEDQMSGTFAQKFSPKRDKNSSGGKRTNTLNNGRQGTKDPPVQERHNTVGMMSLQIPSNQKDSQPRLQGLSTKIKQKETKQSIVPEGKNEFLFYLHGPQEENNNDEFEREDAIPTEVAEEHNKPDPSSHKRIYSQNFKQNHNPFDEFEEGYEASKVGLESPIRNSPAKKMTNETFSSRNQNDIQIKMVKVQKANLESSDQKLVIKKSKVMLKNENMETPNKKGDLPHVTKFETVVKTRQLIKSFIEQSKSGKMGDRKNTFTPKIDEDRKIQVKQPPSQPFNINHLNEINFSQQSLSDKDQAQTMQNQNLEQINPIHSRNKTIKLPQPGTQRHLIPFSQPVSDSVTQITSYRELLEVFGVELGPDNTFSHHGRMFKLNIQQKPLKIRKTDRSSNVSQHHYQTQIIKENEPIGRLKEQPPFQQVKIANLEQKARSLTPNIVFNNQTGHSQDISSKNGSIQNASKSQQNLYLPPTAKSNGQLNMQSQMLQNSHMKLLKSQKSQFDSYSARRSDHSRRSQKSAAVSNHEQVIERQKRRLRQKSQHRMVADYNRLQIERQNQTDLINSNQGHITSLENIRNLTQRQLSSQIDRKFQNQVVNQMGPSKNSEPTLSGANMSSSLQIESNQTAPINSSDPNQVKINKVQTQNLEPMLVATEFFSDDIQRPRTYTTTNFEELRIADQNVHLAFLFASPLMLQISDKQSDDMMVPLPPISFAEEFEQILNQLEEKKVSINYQFSVATKKNLLNILRQNPVGLHFSGHGFQNNEKLYNGDKMVYKKNKDKGDVLIFEKENGASDFFFLADLKSMLESIKTQVQAIKNDKNFTMLKFVYVASCHSEEVGKFFIEAGVPHVICIKQTETILDMAAVEFSKAFYDEVFDKYLTVCEAYENALKMVEEKFGGFQAKKILLYKNDETHGDSCTKDERFMPVPGRGFPEQVEEQTDLIYLPIKVSPFVFRNKDMFDVLQLLSEEQTFIVQIWGMPGLGKSSLLKNVTCFLAERSYYKNGVIYIDFMHVTKFQEVVQIMNAYLGESLNRSDFINDSEIEPYSDEEDTLHYELKNLKMKLSQFDKKILFALDNIEHLKDEPDHPEFQDFMNFIGEVASKNVKILFSSSKYEAQLMPEDKFQVKKILKLSKKESVQLFIKKIPFGNSDKEKFFDYENIEELHQATVEKYGEEIEQRVQLCKTKRHTHSQECVIKYLQDHPLFLFLAGIPLVISIVASMTVKQSLTQIFLYLADKNSSDLKKYKHKIDDDSLLNCLEYCTNYLQKRKDKSALRMWYLIGTQGPGIFYEDIKEIWSAAKQDSDNHFKVEEQKTPAEGTEETPVDKIDESLNELIQFSLIEVEILDKAGNQRRFRVSPFVDMYLNNKIDKKFHLDTLNLVCTHLNQKLSPFKQEYSDNIVKCTTQEEVNQVIQKLLEQIRPYEQQILHNVLTMFQLSKTVDDFSSMNEMEEDLNSVDLDETSPINQRKEIRLSLASSKKENKKLKKGQASTKQSSELIPVVSEFLRDARSSMVLDKSDNRKKMLLSEQDLEDFKHKKKPNQEQDVHPLKPISDRRLTNVKEEDEESKEEEGEIWTLEKIEAKKKAKVKSFYDTSMRDRYPNLGFLDAKEEFKRDRNISLFGNAEGRCETEEDNMDSARVEMQRRTIMNDRDRAYNQNNPQDEPLGSSRTPSNRFATASARNDFENHSEENSEDQSPFKNIFESAFLQQNFQDTMPFKSSIRRKQTILPPKQQEMDFQRRQSKNMKRLETLKLGHEAFGEFKIMRNTIHQKSMSNGHRHTQQLKSFQHNPDLVCNPALPECDEIEMHFAQSKTQNFSIHNSAPPKNLHLTESTQNKDLLVMEDHEQLLCNFLSILALIPEKYNDFMNILDAYGQRKRENKQKNEEKKEFVVDLVKQAERRLQKQRTFVELPEDSKLLIANTKMLELYVTIQMNNDQSEQNRKDRKKKFDRINELANEIGKNYFEKINFTRGLAMVYYVQAIRQYTQFKKSLQFKELIRQSAYFFFRTHEIDGIDQCLEVAEKYLQRQKGDNIDKVEKNHKFIDELQKLRLKLTDCSDCDVNNFVKFRQNMKIKNLAAKLVIRNGQVSASDSNALSSASRSEHKSHIQMDRILNMLLNSQMQLRIK